MTQILHTLKAETADWHSRVEKLVPVFEDAFTLASYRHLLERFYGFYLPFETLAGKVPNLERHLPDWPERTKLVSLEADLLWLECRKPELSALPLCSLMPRLDDLPSVFGALYVTEGSTLGGQIISRHLTKSLNVAPDEGAAFFSSYGPCTGARWRIFTGALCRIAVAQDERAIVQSAVDTFRVLWLWLSSEIECQ